MPGEVCDIVPMTAADRDLVFAWRNLPGMVALSGSGRTVSWDEHVAWFARVLQAETCLIWKIVSREEPIGQIRFDIRAGTRARAVVTIFILPSWTGRGLGRVAFRQALAQLEARWPEVEVVEAEVIAGNAGARRFFDALGFAPRQTATPGGTRAVVRLERPCRGSDGPEEGVP